MQKQFTILNTDIQNMILDLLPLSVFMDDCWQRNIYLKNASESS